MNGYVVSQSRCEQQSKLLQNSDRIRVLPMAHGTEFQATNLDAQPKDTRLPQVMTDSKLAPCKKGEHGPPPVCREFHSRSRSGIAP
jgi:hypothetical protein